MLIHKDALYVHEAGDKGRTRYFLDGAYIDAEGRAVATDGHMLVRFASHAGDASAFASIAGADKADAVIVSRDDLRAALATIGGEATDVKHIAIVPNGTDVTLATATKDRTVTIITKKQTGTFPNYEAALKVKTPVVATVILNPELLETLARMARQVGAKSLHLAIHGNDPANGVLDQVLFRAEGRNGTLDGAIMPMRP